MSGYNLSSIVQQNQQNQVRPMNLMGSGDAAPSNPAAASDGVAYGGRSAGVSSSIIQETAKKLGFVAGYIMGSAPAVSLSLQRTSKKDEAPTYSIVAKESKPSRPLKVCLALPQRCCMKGGTLATPDDIKAGMIDFNSIPDSAMVYQAFDLEAAISYIGVLGAKLPEYPQTIDGGKPWTAEEILYGNPKVSFVRVNAATSRSRKVAVDGQFKFSLKTTSDRRSLYTRKNHVCLRALKHIPVTCNSEEDAYRLNESAFGGWRFRQPKDMTVSALQNAFNNCPTQIWRQSYTINGETIEDGIGSIFFMPQASMRRTVVVNGNEEEAIATRQQLLFFPWWATGALRQSPVKMEKMVERTLRPAEGNKKPRMVTHPIFYKDAPNDPMFKQYAGFVDFITSKGFVREDELKAMGGRAVRATKRVDDLSSDQWNALSNYMSKESTQIAIQTAQHEASTRAALSK